MNHSLEDLDIIAYAEEAEFDHVLECLEFDPTLAQVEDGFGMLALHWICTETTRELVSVELVEKVVSAYPRALEHRTSSNFLPLHIALSSNWCALHLELLLSYWPESVLALDGEGRSPVELAAGLPAHTQALLERAVERVVSGQDFEQLSVQCRVQVEERHVVQERLTEIQRPSLISSQLTGLVAELSKLGRELSKSNTHSNECRTSVQYVAWDKPQALGITFEPLADSVGAQVQTMANSNNSSGVERGDVLYSINDLQVDTLAFGRIIEALENASSPCRLGFISASRHEEDKMMKRSGSSVSVASLASTDSSSMSFEQEQTMVRVSNLLEETMQKVHEAEHTFRMSMST